MPCSKHEKTTQPATVMPTATTIAPDDLLAQLVGGAVSVCGEADEPADCTDSPSLNADRVWSTAERQAVVGQLLEQHFDRVYRYAYYLSGCASVAEDLAQEVFLRAFRSVHQLRNQQASVGWLLTIARNEFGRYCQSRKIPLDIDNYAPIENSNHIRQIDCQDWVRFALDQLPVEFRTVVLMFYFEEKSYAQIAAELELPMGTVMSRLSRARNHLKQALETQTASPSSKPPAGALVKDNQ